MRWKVTYIKEDEDRRIHYHEEVEALDYTKAYMKFLYDHPKTHIIVKLDRIKREKETTNHGRKE